MRSSGSMSQGKKSRLKNIGVRRFLYLIAVTFICLLLVIPFLKTNPISSLASDYVDEAYNDGKLVNSSYHRPRKLQLPRRTPLSISIEKRNEMPPRNANLYPSLMQDRVIIVLYVHNRPHYLRVVIQSLSHVVGINETLLIVSHDGYFEEMNKIVEGIAFCQVKQIFAPYSPHLFSASFPGVSPRDCKDDGSREKGCKGNPDQYGHYRSPRIISLKHHWWWMMNTVWDGLKETRQHSGHILFIEEDHYIFPNAYRNLQVLISLKSHKCPDCYAVNLAPSDVKSKGEGWGSLIAERMGNVGYAFNRTVWMKIHRKAMEFCTFDDYNWDITMWTTVFPSFGQPVYSLRGPRRSAAHFGTCGLHQGQGDKKACIVDGEVKIESETIDEVVNIKEEWGVHLVTQQDGYRAGFRGWGGWGDSRDHQLCFTFASMYYSPRKIPS